MDYRVCHKVAPSMAWTKPEIISALALFASARGLPPVHVSNWPECWPKRPLRGQRRSLCERSWQIRWVSLVAPLLLARAVGFECLQTGGRARFPYQFCQRLRAASRLARKLPTSLDSRNRASPLPRRLAPAAASASAAQLAFPNMWHRWREYDEGERRVAPQRRLDRGR